MATAKKGKVKMVDGFLCRDTKARGGDLIFFYGPKVRRCHIRMVDGYYLWNWNRNSSFLDERNYYIFTIDQWKQTYDLEPPRTGASFEASIEL